MREKPRYVRLLWAYGVVEGQILKGDFPSYLTPEQLAWAFQETKNYDQGLEYAYRRFSERYVDYSFITADALCQNIYENVRMWAIALYKNPQLAE